MRIRRNFKIYGISGIRRYAERRRESYIRIIGAIKLKHE